MPRPSGQLPLMPIALLAFAIMSFIFFVDLATSRPANTPIHSGDSSHNNCVITGCSRELCADQPIISSCIFLPAYACYRSATCQRQANGQCGWTMTPTLVSCLRAASP